MKYVVFVILKCKAMDKIHNSLAYSTQIIDYLQYILSNNYTSLFHLLYLGGITKILANR